MKKTLLPVLVVLLLVSTSARAGTDYKCVSDCMQNHETAGACVQECTKDLPTAPKARKNTKTDYVCLKLCLKGGKTSTTCLPQCSYGSGRGTNPATLPSVMGNSDPAAPTHKMLQAPVPAGDMLVAPKQKAPAKNAGKNYSCIAQCVHDGMQAQLCNENCLAVTPEYNGAK